MLLKPDYAIIKLRASNETMALAGMQIPRRLEVSEASIRRKIKFVQTKAFFTYYVKLRRRAGNLDRLGA